MLVQYTFQRITFSFHVLLFCGCLAVILSVVNAEQDILITARQHANGENWANIVLMKGLLFARACSTPGG